MNRQRKIFGRLPMYKGDWAEGVVVKEKFRFTYRGSEFQALRDGLTTAPLDTNDDVNEGWKVISNGTAAYRADARIRALETKKMSEDDIESSAVTGPKIAENAITTSKIADGAVQSNDINETAFDDTLSTSRKLADAKIVGDKFTEQESKLTELENIFSGELVVDFSRAETNPGVMTTFNYTNVTTAWAKHSVVDVSGYDKMEIVANESNDTVFIFVKSYRAPEDKETFENASPLCDGTTYTKLLKGESITTGIPKDAKYLVVNTQVYAGDCTPKVTLPRESAFASKEELDAVAKEVAEVNEKADGVSAKVDGLMEKKGPNEVDAEWYDINLAYNSSTKKVIEEASTTMQSTGFISIKDVDRLIADAPSEFFIFYFGEDDDTTALDYTGGYITNGLYNIGSDVEGVTRLRVKYKVENGKPKLYKYNEGGKVANYIDDNLDSVVINVSVGDVAVNGVEINEDGSLTTPSRYIVGYKAVLKYDVSRFAGGRIAYRKATLSIGKAALAIYNENDEVVKVDSYGNDYVVTDIPNDARYLYYYHNLQNLDGVDIRLAKKGVEFDAINIDCVGDSLTQGGAYINALYSLIPNAVIENLGCSGEGASEILGRMNGIPFILAEGVTIPSSGAVEIKMKNSYGQPAWVLLNGRWTTFNVRIGGIEGVLSVEKSYTSGDNDSIVVAKYDSKYYFTRNESGTSATLLSGEPIVILDTLPYIGNERYKIIWVGTNLGYAADCYPKETNGVGAEPYPETYTDTDIARLISMIKTYIDVANPKDYIVLTPTTATRTSDLLERMFEQSFGAKCINIRKQLMGNGIRIALEQGYLVGEYPTAQDVADIEAGKIPSSMTQDYTHLSAAGYKVAAWLMRQKMSDLWK